MARAISVTEGAGTAFGFLFRSWPRAVGALTLVGLLGGGVTLAFRSHDFAHGWLLFAAYLLAAVMARGALFRIWHAERRPDDQALAPGFSGFQWGAIEWRLLGVVLLRGLLFGLFGALFLTVLAAIYVGMAAAETARDFAVAVHAGWRPSLDPLGWTVVSAVGLAGTVGLCWIGLRLYLAFAATVAVGRVQLLSAWGLTRGHVWRIFGSLVLVLSPWFGVVVLARVGRGVLTSGGAGDPRTIAAASSLIMSFGQAFLALPLSVGLMIYLYDRLGPEDVGVS